MRPQHTDVIATNSIIDQFKMPRPFMGDARTNSSGNLSACVLPQFLQALEQRQLLCQALSAWREAVRHAASASRMADLLASNFVQKTLLAILGVWRSLATMKRLSDQLAVQNRTKAM
eukprot:scaffold410224_cov18-Prasinocladus_malaysianus.AAC.2